MTLFCVLSCSVDMPPSNEPTVHVEQNPELGTKLSGVLGGLAEWGVQGLGRARHCAVLWRSFSIGSWVNDEGPKVNARPVQGELGSFRERMCERSFSEEALDIIDAGVPEIDSWTCPSCSRASGSPSSVDGMSSSSMLSNTISGGRLRLFCFHTRIAIMHALAFSCAKLAQVQPKRCKFVSLDKRKQ